MLGVEFSFQLAAFKASEENLRKTGEKSEENRMKVLGVISLLLGLGLLVLGFGLLSGNIELANAPGSMPRYLPTEMQGLFRWLLGVFCWSAALFFTIAWLAIRELPGLSWLSLILLVLFFPLYIFGGALMPDFSLSLMMLLILAVLLPILLSAIASLIAGAVRRSRLRKRAFGHSVH
ncbi:hypothetical protein [Psychromicrobium lacuslunae]|uniref:Uncharacterized protein n=1 Tax=Psychromicrobium lacuslunae TaxID=1618207 RepID=A0A0D4C0X6_9MICC|nr:hypothetical protein [Psychromicrobium lacuslunae]AJT42209.1 hypothetical protein UM93_13125 [Psychromicrobium lacuslunae]